MDKQRLKNYLKDILELEKAKLETEQIIQRLESQKYVAESYEMVSFMDANKGKKENNIGSSFGGFFVGGAVVGFVISILMVASGWYQGSIFLVMLICGVISGIIGAMIASKDEENRKTSIMMENEQISQKNAAIRAQNRELKLKAEQKNALTLKSCGKFKKTLQDVEETLKTLYSKDVIYPKYRNIVAVSSIYEYLDSGRCSELEGADGAYNTYELEMRLNKIITQMDVIIRKLDQIVTNQYYLYAAIKEIQPSIDRITEEISKNTEKLNEIAVTSAITAYTTQVIERNQYYGRNWKDSNMYQDRINMPKV